MSFKRVHKKVTSNSSNHIDATYNNTFKSLECYFSSCRTYEKYLSFILLKKTFKFLLKFLSMAKICNKCEHPASIKTNNLNYCKECFIALFHNKINKKLLKFKKDEKILLYLSSSESSIILIDIINKFLTENNRFNVKVVSCNDKFNKMHKFDTIELKNNPSTIQDLIDFCKIENYNAFIYQKCMEESVCDSFEYILKGSGKMAAEIQKIYCENLRIINIFEEIKMKELTFYFYIKNYERFLGLKKPEKCRETVKNFLAGLDSKNNLVLFNLLSMFKKL